MDINMLEADEFEVECLVRDIHGNPLEKLSILQGRINNEELRPVLKPHRMHNAARKDPKRELQKCRNKAIEFKEWLSGVNPDGIVNFTKLQKIKARLLHLIDRLHRLERSKSYKAGAIETNYLCGELLLVVHSITAGSPTLNDTLDKVRSITSFAVVDLSDSEEDVSDSEYESEKGSDQVNFPPVVLDTNAPNSAQPIQCVSSPTINQISQSNRITTAAASLNRLPSNQENFNDELREKLSNARKSRSVQFSDVSMNASYAPTQIPHTQLLTAASTRQLSSAISSSRFASTNIMDAHSGSEYISPHLDSAARRAPLEGQYSNMPQIHRPYLARTTIDHRDLAQSGICFDGSPEGLPVERFLFRLEHFARSRGIPADALVDNLNNVLKGIAQDWFWCHLELNSILTWLQLKEDFLARFQDRRSNYDVRRIIEDRKQTRKETFIEFYNQILLLTLQSRVALPEQEILHLLRRNMRPGLQLALANQTFQSVNELISRCVALEDTWARLNVDPELLCQPRRHINELEQVQYDNVHDNYLEPRNRYQNMNTVSAHQSNATNTTFSVPDFGMPPPIAHHDVDAISAQPHQPNIPIIRSRQIPSQPSLNPPTLRMNNFSTEPMVCWNCFDLGHLFKECPKLPQHLFCYGCGRTNVIKPRCHHCKSTAENLQRRISHSGRISPVPGANPRASAYQTNYSNNRMQQLTSNFSQLKPPTGATPKNQFSNH